MAKGLPNHPNSEQVRQRDTEEEENFDNESTHSTEDNEELPTEEEQSDDDEDLFAASDDDEDIEEVEEEESDDDSYPLITGANSPFIHLPRNPRVRIAYRSIFEPRFPEGWTLDLPLQSWVTRLRYWLNHLNDQPSPSLKYYAHLTYCQNFQRAPPSAFLHPVPKEIKEYWNKARTGLITVQNSIHDKYLHLDRQKDITSFYSIPSEENNCSIYPSPTIFYLRLEFVCARTDHINYPVVSVTSIAYDEPNYTHTYSPAFNTE
jgi:hypothetical protein